MFITHSKFFKAARSDYEKDGVFYKMERELPNAITNHRALLKGLIVLGLIILGLIFSRKIGVNPAIIAFTGGVVLFIISGIPRLKILKNGGWADVLFFAALFVLVGAAEASGLLVFIARGIILKLSNGHTLAMAILLLCFASFLTAFMNAGPTTALFIPVVMHFGIEPHNNLFWWALSLGVVSGSSASLYGASGGPLAASIIGKYWKRNKKFISSESPLYNLKNTISFMEYLKIGGPIMIIFLKISIIYITFLYFF